ncbi:uncharacterized protein LOC141726098 [Zonotrichia albicollis]|uniref:uncharacterized protein LOC141726098 n=1 Tax=Zonotrichia albicollis TaxID=44394 RepID=UPI003D80FE03
MVRCLPRGGAEQSHLHISQHLEHQEHFACGVPRGEEAQDPRGRSEENQALLQDHSSDRATSIPPREPQRPLDQTSGVPACTLYTLYTLCTMLRDRGTLSLVQQRREEDEEEGRTESAATTSAQPAMERGGTKGTGTTAAQPAMERKGTKDRGTGTTAAQPAMERKGTKDRGTGTTAAQPAMERKGTKGTGTTAAQPAMEREGTKDRGTGTTAAQPAMKRKGIQRAASASTQTVTHPGQPKAAAAAPVQKKKSKSKSMQTETAEEVAGPSHPAEEPVVITVSVSLLQRELSPQSHECTLAGDSTRDRQLAPLSWHVLNAQGIRRAQGTLSPGQ